MRGRDIDSTVDGTPGAIVRRRWPVVVVTALVVGIGALAWTLAQTDRYRAEAGLLLSRTFIDASLTGTPQSTAQTDPAAMAGVEATLADLPLVASRTLRAAGYASGAAARRTFLANSMAEVALGAPLVSFIVNNRDPRRATLLANTWARTTDAYRVELDGRAVTAALKDVEQRLTRLERGRDTRSELYRSLIDKQQQLQTVLTLQRSSATIIRPATHATQVTRSPASAAVLGTVAGAILGLALIFLWELLRGREPPRDTFVPLTRREREEELVP